MDKSSSKSEIDFLGRDLEKTEKNIIKNQGEKPIVDHVRRSQKDIEANISKA